MKSRYHLQNGASYCKKTHSTSGGLLMETSPSATSSYSHTEQSVAQDLSLKQISQIFLNNWLLFVVLFVAFCIISGIVYVSKIPYMAQSTITVNDVQNSSLQSFASQFFGMSKTVSEGKKNNSPLLKHVEYLKTTDFFEKLLTQIQETKDSKNLTMAEQEGYAQFRSQYLSTDMNEEARMKVLTILDSYSRTKLDSDFELKVSFIAPTKEMALFLTNTALAKTLEVLKQRELSDILKIEKFIQAQIESTEENIAQLNLQLAEFQNKPENLISLSSKEKVGEYLSDLMVRKNELKMKIAENQKVIEYLSQGKKDIRESQLYGNGGRIQALRLENQMHEDNLAQIQASVNRVTSMAKAIPIASQIFEDLKKKSEIEFEKYKGLSENLSKAEAQKLSIESRFEILETARFDRVKPMVSLFVLLLISIVLSQILGSLIIYVTSIWDSSTVTSKSSRNVVIIDSHSLDPRIVIEDSKIRFRLKNANYDESESDDNEMREQRLTFRLFNQKSVNGDETVENG